ncbi:Glucosamine 6-phosphate N-acetyltransferase [Mycena chlorophos]|uniref:Glucosamine 6-phosphate N-acetyltransferase n=1 Tax=Mycena chlorophos TaxID=658473 RepID=A0A8H6WJ27_MYCCL|nr:Glucosamine 6-phosphate N-acetyltransferase [Mycena chlorophos]
MQQRPLISCRPISAADTVPLRHSVLWPDKDVSYVLLPEDATGWHFGAFISRAEDSSDSGPEDNAHPLAVISLFVEDCPVPISIDKKPLLPAANADAVVPDRVRVRAEEEDNGDPAGARRSIRFRKFACEPGYQGRGIGTQLLKHAAEAARTELDGGILWCDARESTRSWYERRGLEAFGDRFFKSAVPYTRMKMTLESAE